MTTQQDKQQQLQDIGKSAMDAIAEMVEALNNASDEDARDEAQEAIRNDPLSVMVRSDWTPPGEKMKAGEFEILLSTGGPATRIIGELDQHGEPITATLQAQDWFQPWTDYREADKEVLLAYCREFYFEV